MTCTQPDKIYALYQEDEDGYLNYFYAGRSSDPVKRFTVHKNDKTGSEKSILIQYCIKNGIKIGCTIIRDADRADSEAIAYWDLHNAGHHLLNQIDCNENRSDEFFTLAKKDLKAIPFTHLKKAKNWTKHPFDSKKKVMSCNGWTISKASFAVGHFIEIRGNDHDISFYDRLFDWKSTYISLILILDALMKDQPLPKFDHITYK